MQLRLTGLWRQPDFLKLWAAQTVSAFGTQITAVALPLTAALFLDASPAEMGILSAAGAAPFLLIGLFVGVWVDRLRRRPLLIAADLARFALLLLIPLAWALDVLSIGALCAIAFLVGAFTVIFDVAYVSYLPTLVRRDEIVEGNSKMEASYSMAQVGGPGLAGTLVGLLSGPLAILFDAVSYLVSCLFLWRIRAPEPERVPADGGARMWREIHEGLRTVFGNPMLRALSACSATTTFFGWVFLSVYVLYLTEDLRLGPTAVGFVFSLGGVGALLGAILAGPANRRFGVGPTMVGSQALVGIFGMAIPLAVLVPSLALPMVLFSEFAQWMMLVIYFVTAVSLRQSIVPDRLQGRVSGTVRFLVTGSQPLGALLGGALGETIGVRPTLVVGITGMLAAFLWLFFSPARTMRELPSGPAEERQPVLA